MVTQLPVRIEFALPDGWRAAPPDEVNAPGVAFVALHPSSANGFTANITIAGQLRPPRLAMTEIAEESVRRLTEAGTSVRIRQRTEVGAPDSPGLTQVLDLETVVDGRPLNLKQCQVYVSMTDVADPARRAVLEVALTCTPAQLPAVFDDFQAFVTTIRPTDTSAAG
jgi:hypothetical protein